MATAEVTPVSREYALFAEQEQTKDLLRFTTAGSVDDGKSTLIGRLLYDSRSVYEDQLESVSKASAGGSAGTLDFALLTDGLRAEREQGITIDVAHRYFNTAKRKFIIADTPGHEQYTRNMVTGASTSDLAIVLVDARKGVLSQSRRHAYIASLLGLQHLVVAVNKMDLVNYDQRVFAAIEREFREFTAPFQTLEPYFIPISALAGDNVVHRSAKMPWYEGPSLLEYLEEVPIDLGFTHKAFRFPVQRVVRPNHLFRGYAGTVAAGEIKAGDSVTVLPSGRKTQIAQITTFDGELLTAKAGQAVTLTLTDEVDVSRGDMIVAAQITPEIASVFEATLVWLNEEPAELHRRYRIKHNTHQDWAEIDSFSYRIDINTLEQEAASTLEMNAIGVARIQSARPLLFDPYRANRATGSFILIDAVTNVTVAAGMIARAVSASADDYAEPPSFTWQLKDGGILLGALQRAFSAGMKLDSAEKTSGTRSLDDPEAADLLRRLLERLGIAVREKE